MVDVVTIIVMMIILSEVFSSFSELPDWVRIAAFAFLWGGYEPLLTTIGCTLGQKVAGVRVRKYSDSSKTINIAQAYLRFIIKFFLGFISFFTITTNKERRAMHDLISGTVVIEYKD